MRHRHIYQLNAIDRIERKYIMSYQKQLYLNHKEKYVYVQCYMCEDQKNALIIFPNIGWYHVGPNRIFVQLAGLCNQVGISVYCFDYIGYGESFGDYEIVGWEELKGSCQVVYDYVRSRTLGNLFAMGYGIGNTLLNVLYRKHKFEGRIYYLPICKEKDSLHEILTKINAQCFESLNIPIDIKRNELYVLYKWLFGGVHDCTYNPVTIKLLGEVSSEITLGGGLNYSESTLNIVDEKVEGIWGQVVIPEFKDNKIPEEWYRTPNLWPDTLAEVNNKIIRWLKREMKILSKNSHCLNCEFEYIDPSTVVDSGDSERRIISVESEGHILPSILHCPKKTEKKCPCAIFVPGLGGDKNDNFSNGPRLGKLLSDNGIALFRYDDRYSGASLGRLVDYKLSDIVNDFYNVYNYLLAEVETIDKHNIFLISWSAGAQVVNHVVAEGKIHIKACCYWNPIFLNENHSKKTEMMVGNNTKYIKNSLGEYVCQIGGENLGIGYVKDKKTFDFQEDFQRNMCLKMFIWGDCEINSLEYEYVTNRKSECPFEIVVVNSDAHLFSYELLGEIHQITLKWLKKCEDEHVNCY